MHKVILFYFNGEIFVPKIVLFSQCKITFLLSFLNSRDRIVVSTLRCGRSNPGSNPGHGSTLCWHGRGKPFSCDLHNYNAILSTCIVIEVCSNLYLHYAPLLSKALVNMRKFVQINKIHISSKSWQDTNVIQILICRGSQKAEGVRNVLEIFVTGDYLLWDRVLVHCKLIYIPNYS